MSAPDEAVAGIQAIGATLPGDDGLTWFNRLYLRMTMAVRDRIAAGRFANPPWMAKLDAASARHYFDALQAWERGDRPPGCWRALFSRRSQRAVARIQFALAGLNAHINYDLPLALLETFEATGIEPHSAGVQYGDYISLNSTLSPLAEAAIDEWQVRLPGGPLPGASHLRETLDAWSLTAAREAAWTNAELLWGVRDVPLVGGRYLEVIDGLASVVGKALLVAAPFDAGEPGSPAA